MPVAEIEDLRHERASAFEEMKRIADAAEAEDRDLTAEEKQEFERAEGEFDVLAERISRQEKIEGIVKRGAPQPVIEPEAVESGRKSDEYREAFGAYLRARGGLQGLTPEHREVMVAEQRAALQVGTDNEGGYTVPESWENRLIEQTREFGVIRNLATVITTATGSKINIPTIATFPTAVLTAEEAGFTESEATFGEKQLDAYKYGTIAKFSDELRQDSLFDIDALVQRLAGQAIALKEDAALATGTGSSQPEGLMVGLSTGVTAAAADAITADELIGLYHSVTSPYRANASWVLNDTTAAAVRVFKDGNGQYLWQPGLQAGQPDMLLGKPVYTDPFIDSIAAAKDVVAFGDIGLAYTVRQAGGIVVKVLEELYAANGQVGVRVHRRTDGAVVDANAAKVLTTAAS